MTRLEFVSMSLIKGLKGVIYIGGEQEIVTLKSIDTDGNEIWVSNDNWVYSSLNYDIKIICRKLSDLTKEIEHGGDKIIPVIDIFLKNVREIKGRYIIFKNGYSTTIGELKFKQVQKLIEWKFNLMDESEEFININDLDINPYK